MELVDQLEIIIASDRIKSRPIDLLAYAADAGFYNLVPKAVVQPVTEKEIIALFQFSHEKKLPIVFRTGGTSLSGQSITDGILVDLSKYWNALKVEHEGEYVRVQPGITGSMVNAYLRKYKRKIGPDPSSISAAMMGGILSNNSSGMCCGVVQNAYHTTKYIRFILPDGNSFSTEIKEDYQRFQVECSELYTTIQQLREEVRNNLNLSSLIRKKYETKNTVGYSLNALLDYEHPLDIFSHLLIGAEGTLAFIAEAVLETVPEHPYKSTALLYFPDIYAACQAIIPLKNGNAAMVELMDRASLRSIENVKGIDPYIQTLPEKAAALLIEFQEPGREMLQERVASFLSIADGLLMLNTPAFTEDPVSREFFWKIRKGLFPAVGAVRASGTTVILEDIAFPLESLGDAVLDLQQLFLKYQYFNAIIFGHAKDGNLHFVVTQTFDGINEIDRYDKFLREVVNLVVNKYNGTLKAEHGTGRNMAPFVETEWGGDAYRIMRRIKQAADPSGLLNPGVIINDDPEVHRKNLKQLPVVETEVDKCIECGYCEPVCPSRDITLTPRRRIVVRRALALLKQNGETATYNNVLSDYQYDGLDTCAVDGLCSTACPVDINTGDLVKRLRRENHSPMANAMASWVSRNFHLVVWSARTALAVGGSINAITGGNGMLSLTKSIRKIIPSFPLWNNNITGSPGLNALQKKSPGNHVNSIIYFPSCISRMMGMQQGNKNLVNTFLEVADKTGFNVILPDKIYGACCGQIFSSKGYHDAFKLTANKIVNQLWQQSENGNIPVVIDVSSCAYTLHHLKPVLQKENLEKFEKLRIYDSVDFLCDMVLPVITVKQKKKKVILHPVCSLKKMGTENKFLTIAAVFANEVVVPQHSGCCGMAGDRGFLFPELTASATAPEAEDVKGVDCDGYFSSTKTCELSLSSATGKNYESILFLVNEGL
jgi:D-lactate dehydrogenase